MSRNSMNRSKYSNQRNAVQEDDPRDRIIEDLYIEIQELQDLYTTTTNDLRAELQIYASKASKIQDAMLARILDLKSQIARKKEAIYYSGL